MIQSGLYNELVTNPSIQALLPTDGKSPATSQAGQCVHFVRAPKDPLTPYIVIHLPDVPPAEATLEGVTEQTIGSIQFDCYASEPNGAKLARQLTRAVRELFTPSGGPNFSGTLSDGTEIEFLDVLADFDDGYEAGATNYLFRSVLRLQAFYTEGPNTL